MHRKVLKQPLSFFVLHFSGVFFTFVFAPLLMLMTCVAFFVMSLGTLTCEPLLTYDLLRVVRAFKDKVKFL